MIKQNAATDCDVLILTQYPIVDQLRDDIHSSIGKNVDFVVVSTLAADGYNQLLSSLRQKHYSRLYVYIDDETALPLAAILKVISFVVPADSRFLMMPKRSAASYSIFDIALSATSIVVSAVQGGVMMLSLAVRAKYLKFVNRMALQDAPYPKDIQDFAYIKTNLWLGVQAGGALTHTWGVVGGLLRRGAKVRYLSTDMRGGVQKGNFSHVSIKPANPYVIPREFNHFLYHSTFCKIARCHLADFSGAIYQRISIGNFAGVELSRRYALPLIIEYNGSESWLARNWGTPFAFPRVVALAEEVSLRHAHVVATVSKPLKHELIERGVEADRIVVHPNGVDPTVFDPTRFSDDFISALRKQLGVPPEGILISFVGTFGPWHGAEQLALAARELIRKRKNAGEGGEYFLFIGDGVRRTEVESFAGDLIDEGRVIITGLVNPEDVPGYLAASDILASPTVRNPDKSPFFGSPTKLFEYMAAGKPIIASKIGQIEEIMAGSYLAEDLAKLSIEEETKAEDKIGILTSPGNVVDLCDAIQFLSENKTIRRAWGSAARQRVLENYTWDHHVAAIANKLNEVLDFEKTRKTVVLINGLHSKSGGGVTYLKNILPLFCSDQRLDVHLCINQRQVSLFEPYLSGVTLHVVNFDNSLWRLLLSEQIAIPKLALKINADVTFSPANYGPLLARRSVVLLRNALSVAFVERRLSKTLYWLMLYAGTLSSIFRARRVVCVSEYAKKTAVGSTIGSSPDKFQTIPHGISGQFAEDRAIDREPNTLLCVSDIYIQKNLHTFFESLPKLREEYPNLKVRVAGAPLDKEYMTGLENRLLELKMNSHVTFLGNLDVHELKKCYQSTALFVFPSTVETFGNPLVEAMACGCPIATSNTAAMPEVAGDAAAYFDPYDIEDITDVIINLLENPDRREELSRRAVERAKMFSWEETARKTADILIEAARK